MNHNIFSKIVAKTTIFSLEYKEKLIKESKSFLESELIEILKFIFEEEEKPSPLTPLPKVEWEENRIKSKEQIKNIKISGKYLNKLLKILYRKAKVGVSLIDLEKEAIKFFEEKNIEIIENNKKNIKESNKKNIKKSNKKENNLIESNKKNFIKSSFKGVDLYKNHININVNNNIYHQNISNYTLKNGDLITIDAGVNYNGGITDSAVVKIIGGEKYNKIKSIKSEDYKIKGEKYNKIKSIKSEDYKIKGENYKTQKMIFILKNVLDKHIKNLKPGYNMYDFCFNFYIDIISSGFKIIKNCSGHGTGNLLHESPYFYNWPCEYMKNIVLEEGNVFTLEPIITFLSSFSLEKDGKGYLENDIGAYFEYTILITKKGYQIISGLYNLKPKDLEVNYDEKNIKIGTKMYNLLIADTKEKRELGLMFREELEQNLGMLFIFDEYKTKVFTMQQTFIDLDIIGIDIFGKVVFLEENIKNYFDINYKEFIYINEKVSYIIELNSGEINKNGIKINDKINL